MRAKPASGLVATGQADALDAIDWIALTRGGNGESRLPLQRIDVTIERPRVDPYVVLGEPEWERAMRALPSRLLDAVADEKDLDDCGTARIEQQAFADFLARGELDRHLRRMRAHYRRLQRANRLGREAYAGEDTVAFLQVAWPFHAQHLH